MLNFNIYREVKSWKKPFHASRTQLAKAYLKLLPKVEIIGITGSVGKTLTQNAIYSVLSQKFRVNVGEENLDPTFRIPQTILSTKPWHQKMVLEYGVEHPGDMDYYLSIASPKIGVVTSIGPTHLKYFKNIEGVFREKAKLIKALPKDGLAILCADDPLVSKMATLTKAQVKWFGKKALGSVKISHFSQNLGGAKFRLHFEGQKATVSWKIIGEHQLTAVYAATSVGQALGLTLKQIAKGLASTKAPLHRLNPITSHSLSIIDDTYNSSPKAAQEAIKTLLVLGKRKQKIAVLGEMKDLGEESLSAHIDLGQKLAKSNIDFLITVGKIAQIIAKSAQKNHFGGKIISAGSAQEALSKLTQIITARPLILIKGSRHAHLERIVLGLQGKPTTIECYHCGVLH